MKKFKVSFDVTTDDDRDDKEYTNDFLFDLEQQLSKDEFQEAHEIFDNFKVERVKE